LNVETTHIILKEDNVNKPIMHSRLRPRLMHLRIVRLLICFCPAATAPLSYVYNSLA